MDTSMDDQVLFDEWVDFEQADLSHHPKPMPGNPLSACPPGRSFTNPIPSAGQELTPGLRFPYDSFADPSHLSMVTTDPVVDQDFISPAVTHQPLTRVGAQNQFEVEDLERLIQLTAGNKEPTIPGLTVDGSSAGGNSPTLRALPLVESTGTATANNIAEARRHDDVWTTPRITDVPVDHMMIDAEDRHHHHHPYGAGGVVPDGKQTSVIGHDFPLMTFPAGVIDVDGSGAIFGGDLHASPQNQQTSFSWEEVAQQSYPQMPLQAIGPVSSPLSPPETPPPPVESRPKQTRRVHDPEETKEIRNEGACSHCSILKQKVSERSVPGFGPRSGVPGLTKAVSSAP